MTLDHPFLQGVLRLLAEKGPEIVGYALFAAVIATITVMRRPNRHRVSESSSPPADHGSTDPIGLYLEELRLHASSLSFGDPSSWSSDVAGSRGLVTLEQLWTPLRVADSHIRRGRSGTHESMAEEGIGAAIEDVLDSADEPLVVLGEPGSGKSTCLAYFATQAALKSRRGDPVPLPVWVQLGAVTADPRGDPIGLLMTGVTEIEIIERRHGPAVAGTVKEQLAAHVRRGHALLLLDGLDEVQEHELARVRAAIAHVARLCDEGQLVVTCRTFDYRQAVPTRKVPIQRELELLPYRMSERRLYVQRWYEAAVRVGRFTPGEAAELAETLQAEIEEPTVVGLAESPLLLALLTLIHSEEARLPDTRAVVCDLAIKYMLAESPKWRTREAGMATVASGPVVALAVGLAHRMHEGEDESEGSRFELTMEAIRQEAERICSTLREADGGTAVLTPDSLLQRFTHSHGLLQASGAGQFRFAHRSFQEFLAGQRYAQGAHHGDAIRRAASLHWREPFRLTASFAGHDGGNLFYILALIEDLLDVSDAQRQQVHLAAEMLIEIGRSRLALHDFGMVLREPSDDGLTPGLWSRARDRLASHVEDPASTLAERERAASVLALLGDPRFVDSSNRAHAPVTHMVEVPAGGYVIGSARLDRSMLGATGGVIGGVRTVELGPYRIGRYLVANAQFREFVESDGYSDRTYWAGELAEGWLMGDPDVLQRIRDHWLMTVHEHHGKEIRDGEINIATLEEEAERRIAPRQAPYYWQDRRFNQANQPVVGLNWWEAAAYCLWATKKGHREGWLSTEMIVSLPTEFEWEAAARPCSDDRTYPWGDEWDEGKAHVSSNLLNLRQPAPLGVYLEHWPGGPVDMAGNVWEWTLSLQLPYAEHFDPQRISSDSLDERVVRGSSWYNIRALAACSARAVDRSYNLFYDVGFRVVVVNRDAVRFGLGR